MSHSSSKNKAHKKKMEPIDETSAVVLKSSSSSPSSSSSGHRTAKVATTKDSSPSRSFVHTTATTATTSTTTTSASSSFDDLQSLDALHNQLRELEDAETAHTISRPQHLLQEEVLENSHKPVPSVVFKYILICMGLCGILIGIALGAIIGQHLLKQQQNQQRYNKEPSDVTGLAKNNNTTTQAPSIAPGLDWHYPPSPRPTSDIFDHVHSSPPTPTLRTAHPTIATPTNSSSGVAPTVKNETTFPLPSNNNNNNKNPTNSSDAGQVDGDRNDTENILP
ncbi:unnamed protein product [Cylindrotheca closterium]|uniref:Uncharacterized protein n=1 Tax=Cylindrotheca closterium TaxID=2856 RepID=A0AAD2CYQ0_9STRA|nr:unnamed protein product [Cylindrotheca closterium]